jgi:hypothetical protein
VTRGALVVCAVLVLAIPSFGGSDQEFNALVKTIEVQYGVRHMHIPLLGLATFCLRVAGTPGTAGLKIAVFDGTLGTNRVSADSFEQSVNAAVGSEWHAIVRARSREDGSVTMIYARPTAKEMALLVVTLDRNDATIVQTKLKTSQIWNWMREPQNAVDHDDGGPRGATFRAAAD